MGIESVLYIHTMKKYFVVYSHANRTGFGWGNISYETNGEITFDTIRFLARKIELDLGTEGVVIASIVSLDSINGK